MSTRILTQIREAIEQLNPADVRETAERPLAIQLTAASSAGYAAIEDFLAPRTVSHQKRLELITYLYRAGDPGVPAHLDLDIYERGLPAPPDGFTFDRRQPGRFIQDVLTRKDELGLPLARLFPPFRRPVTDKVIFNVAKENAFFAIATSMPDLLPGLSLPLAIPAAASDATVLTVNQIRMAFLLAAASDRPVGYREQKKEVGSIIAGAFGWRALARTLVGKVPFGGGILPKAGIAFAATYVEGISLERYYRLGYGLTREERKLAYGEALARGREVAGEIWESVKRRRGEKMYREAVSAPAAEPVTAANGHGSREPKH
ncbi:MAG: hypothetical protein R2762_07790 [Bryobacteraceae bacterium]